MTEINDGTLYTTYEKKAGLLGRIPQKLKAQVTSARYISAY